jgi:tRNA pseudouridine55 synthase
MSNPGIIAVRKPVGATPLQMIDHLKKQEPELANMTLGYAGRLDPMADGVLLILCGDTNLQRKQLEKLPKVYRCEALFGFQTDTYDLLGLLTNTPKAEKIDLERIRERIRTMTGEQIQEYPPYSSPRVKGHPLFWWARSGRLNEITVPSKKIDVKSFEIHGERVLTSRQLLDEIMERLGTITGEFRQEQIKNNWRQWFTDNPNNTFSLIQFEIHCSTGTYIRSLLHELGKKYGPGALAFSITRIAVGDYTIVNARSLD